MYEITSEQITPREGVIDPRLYRAAFAHAQPFRTAYVASHGNMNGGPLANDGQGTPPSAGSNEGKDNSPACVRVAVHIRRGDITRGPDNERSRGRWVPNRAYVQVIDAIYSALSSPREGGAPHSRMSSHSVNPGAPPKKKPDASKAAKSSAMRLCTEIFVETGGLKSAAQIPDLDTENTHGFTNFETRLARYGSVSLVDEPDPLTSFARACSSDILITGKSGYSHLIALMCGSPVVLAFPFWHSYTNMANAMMIKPVERRPAYIDGALLDENDFLALVAKSKLG